MNRSASITDLITLSIIPIVVIVSVVVVGMLYYYFGNALGETDIAQEQATIDTIGSLESSQNGIDYLLFGMFIAMIFGSILSAYFLGNHPVFMIMYFVSAPAIVILALMMNNVIYELFSSDFISPYMSTLPITSFMIYNYLWFIVGTIVFMGVALFMKPSSTAGGYA